MEIKPHINKKTGRPFTTAQYCEFIVDTYDKSLQEYNNNPDPKKGEFISPIGGLHDDKVLAYGRSILEIENIDTRERVAMDRLTNKGFLRMGLNQPQKGAN